MTNKDCRERPDDDDLDETSPDLVHLARGGAIAGIIFFAGAYILFLHTTGTHLHFLVLIAAIFIGALVGWALGARCRPDGWTAQTLRFFYALWATVFEFVTANNLRN